MWRFAALQLKWRSNRMCNSFNFVTQTCQTVGQKFVFVVELVAKRHSQRYFSFCVTTNRFSCEWKKKKLDLRSSLVDISYVNALVQQHTTLLTFIPKNRTLYRVVYEAPFYYLFSIFLISRIRFIDIKKLNTFLDIKQSNSWYQEIISW